MLRAPERYCPVSEVGLLRDFARRTGGHQAAAQPSGAGAEIDHIIGAFDGFGVVLHNQHGVAQIAQAGERIEQPLVIARVQPDGRFVQHVQHAAQLRADLRGQTNSLRLAARERRGRSRQAQIIETDGSQKLQAIADFFDDARRRSGAHARSASRFSRSRARDRWTLR